MTTVKPTAEKRNRIRQCAFNIAVHNTVRLGNLTVRDVSALTCHLVNVTFNPPEVKEQRQVCEQSCSRCHHYCHASHIKQALSLHIRLHQPSLFSYNKPHSVLFLIHRLESGSDSRKRCTLWNTKLCQVCKLTLLTRLVNQCKEIATNQMLQ